MENWLETDELQDAVFALQFVEEQLTKLNATMDPRTWKWVVIGLHNALQGFMVLALRGTDNYRVLTEISAKEWMKANERRDYRFTQPKLDTYLNLYKKIKSKSMCIYTNSKMFKPTGTQDKNVKILNFYRNDFIHFLPKGWLIETSGFPLIVDDCLEIISFLAFDCGNIVWYEDKLELQTEDILVRAKQVVAVLNKVMAQP